MAALRRVAADVRPRLALAAAAITCVVAVVSAATGYVATWDELSTGRARDETLTEQKRERAPLEAIPLSVAIFDFYRSHLRQDDRVYFHVREREFGPFADLPTVVAAAGRFWLLPSVQVEDVEDATVVVSWQRDPAELGIRFSEQHRAQRRFFVSRIAR